jgi:hypothetical protein
VGIVSRPLRAIHQPDHPPLPVAPEPVVHALAGDAVALGNLRGGAVALAEARARWTDTLGRVSDHEGQFGERVGKPDGRRHVGPEIVEAPAEVLDEGVAGDDDPGRAVAL